VLAISSLGYTGEQLVDMFTQDNLKKIFSKDLIRPELFKPKYDGVGKTKFLQSIFGDKLMSDIKKQTYITAYDFIYNQAEIISNSELISENKRKIMYVSDVANASSAAPTYFPPVKLRYTEIDQTKKIKCLIDGGIIANDPSMIAVSMSLADDHINPENAEFSKLLSLGTGTVDQFSHDPDNYMEQSMNWGQVDWLRNGLISSLFNGNSDATELQCSALMRGNYYRVNNKIKKEISDMDNISQNNIDSLKDVALSWYKEHKDNLMKFVSK
jgi:patatin-like phospholipase/acyl hydrolase